jgi:hypothetical protein
LNKSEIDKDLIDKIKRINDRIWAFKIALILLLNKYQYKIT